MSLVRKCALLASALASATLLFAAVATELVAVTPRPTSSRLALQPCRVPGVKEEARCGVYQVYENRQSRQGRMLPLKVILLPAKNPHPADGPIFYMAGGPGEAATELTELIADFGDTEEHDVVLVDERGTGEGHNLDCPSRGSDNDLERYLDGPFNPAAARACRDQLAQQFDLTQYSTPNFVDDIDEIRGAMGYSKINLSAGSFGTYTAMTYMRRHPDHVRTAYLSSLVPLSNRVPLYHAEAAQRGLDELLTECDEDTACHAAYPQVRENFTALMKKVHAAPVLTTVRHPVTGAPTKIHLSERAFADAVRVMLYRVPSAHEIPFLIQQAVAGDFSPFAEAALRANRGIYTGASLGLNYAITCNEFVSRIRPEDVGPATNESFLGAWRVRDQMAACEGWPKTELPADYFQPFQLAAPAVLVSGEADGTGPNGMWGKKVAWYMPNAVHVIVPGAAHTPEIDCTRTIRHALFRTGTTKGLDTGCIGKVARPAFKMPTG
ncbi:MAG: alpha/beta hydrolase [Spartobacteria bacterium]